MVAGAEAALGHAACMVACGGAAIYAAVGMVAAMVVDGWGCTYTDASEDASI